MSKALVRLRYAGDVDVERTTLGPCITSTDSHCIGTGGDLNIPHRNCPARDLRNTACMIRDTNHADVAAHAVTKAIRAYIIKDVKDFSYDGVGG